MLEKRYCLGEYIDALSAAGLLESTDIIGDKRSLRVDELTFDSRNVTAGTLFIAKGVQFKDEYLFSALEKGAVAYISDRVIADCSSFIVVNDIRSAMAFISKMFYCDANLDLTTFAITGTKGKTTTTYYLKDILDTYAAEHGMRETAYISTVDTYDGVESFRSVITTPESPDIWRHYYNAVKSGISNCITEVSSQALKYKRVEGIKFNIACFTNIDTDHISDKEHPDFDDYFASKLMLFDICGIACVNIDDPKSGKVLEYIGDRVPLITYGRNPDATVCCLSTEITSDGSVFTVRTPLWTHTMKITMHGDFNVMNALGAIAMSYAIGVPPQTMSKALEFARVPGRMLYYRSADDRIVVIIDQAHNKNSWENLCAHARSEFPDRALYAVFGLIGGKAYNRREEVGHVVGKHCDYAVITEKNAGDEPFEKIANEIAVHIAEEGCPYDIEEYRPDALRLAFGRKCEKDKVILFGGRGVETNMLRGKTLIPYPTDSETTLKMLAEYDATIVAGKPTN